MPISHVPTGSMRPTLKEMRSSSYSKAPSALTASLQDIFLRSLGHQKEPNRHLRCPWPQHGRSRRALFWIQQLVKRLIGKPGISSISMEVKSTEEIEKATTLRRIKPPFSRICLYSLPTFGPPHYKYNVGTTPPTHKHDIQDGTASCHAKYSPHKPAHGYLLDSVKQVAPTRTYGASATTA